MIQWQKLFQREISRNKIKTNNNWPTEGKRQNASETKEKTQNSAIEFYSNRNTKQQTTQQISQINQLHRLHLRCKLQN